MSAGRVIRVERGWVTLATELGTRSAQTAEELVVGDWVLFHPSSGPIKTERVLPRRTGISRKVSGRAFREQILAANVDYVFVVSSLNSELNPSRLERYLTMIAGGGASPVIVLTKADLCLDPEPLIESIRRAVGDAPILVVSAVTGFGLDALSPYMGPGNTVVLTGSSGTGKSTLINALLGQNRLETGAIRQGDERGRHTTTRREMMLLPSGGSIIDTPGIRELSPWVEEDALNTAFSDIENLGGQCRFRNCSHQGEPGCAVLSAVEEGELEERRLENWAKMGRELRHLQTRDDQLAKQKKKQKDKALHKSFRQVKAFKKNSRRG